MSVLGNILAIIITLLVGFFIFKKYKPQPILLAAGLILLIAAELLGIKTILAEDATTGFFLFDAFTYLKNTMASTASNLGLIIMTVGGYAAYMDYIGAGEAMVRISVKPLKKIGSPYLVLALAYTIGQILNIFIPSAAGLAVLLMATIYPVLIALGVSRLAAASVIATTACLDLGPASGNSNIASEAAGIEAMDYFINYQMVAGVFVILAITATFFFLQKRWDKKMGHVVTQSEIKVAEDKGKKVPTFYALLPILPLFLLMMFNKFVITTISIDVVSAMMLSLVVSVLVEMVVRRDVKAIFKGVQAFFDGMGKQFASTVTLVFTAELFAKGLQAIGLIDAIIEAAKNIGLGAVPMTIIMVLIISLTSFVAGSGNAAFSAFAALGPQVAASFNMAPVVLLMSMQLAAGLARSMSPVASCVIICAATADVSPMEVVKRTIPPMVIGIIVLLLADFLIFL